MNLLCFLPILSGMVIILIISSMIFKSPKQNLQSALAEGALWSGGFFLAFGTEILLLSHP